MLGTTEYNAGRYISTMAQGTGCCKGSYAEGSGKWTVDAHSSPGNVVGVVVTCLRQNPP
jgi:hypothetical protein